MAIAMAQVPKPFCLRHGGAYDRCTCVAQNTTQNGDLTVHDVVQLGGIGFIHYNCALVEQAAAVEAVKSHQPGCAPSVAVVAPDATIADLILVWALSS